MRRHLVLIGLFVVVPVACSDAADGLVDKAVGEWHCENEPGARSDDHTNELDITVERDTFTVHDTGRADVAVGWELDGDRLELDWSNGLDEPASVEGVAENSERIDLVDWRPGDEQHIEVEAVSDAEVTFREDLPGSTTWTCRRA